MTGRARPASSQTHSRSGTAIVASTNADSASGHPAKAHNAVSTALAGHPRPAARPDHGCGKPPATTASSTPEIARPASPAATPTAFAPTSAAPNDGGSSRVSGKPSVAARTANDAMTSND